MLCPLSHRYYILYASLIRLGLATRSDPLHPCSPGTSSLQITSATPHEDAICYILTRFLVGDGQTKVGRNTWRFKHCSRQAKGRKTTSGSKGFKFMICTSKVAIFEVTFGPHSNIMLRFRACSSGKPARVVRLWYQFFMGIQVLTSILPSINGHLVHLCRTSICTTLSIRNVTRSSSSSMTTVGCCDEH